MQNGAKFVDLEEIVQHEYVAAKIGLDAAENELSEVSSNLGVVMAVCGGVSTVGLRLRLRMLFRTPPRSRRWIGAF